MSRQTHNNSRWFAPFGVFLTLALTAGACSDMPTAAPSAWESDPNLSTGAAFQMMSAAGAAPASSYDYVNTLYQGAPPSWIDWTGPMNPVVAGFIPFEFQFQVTEPGLIQFYIYDEEDWVLASSAWVNFDSDHQIVPANVSGTGNPGFGMRLTYGAEVSWARVAWNAP